MTVKELSQSVVEKVEALLRLAKHPNTSVEEAEAAMLAVQRLAAKHGVQAEEFELRESRIEEEVLEAEAVITKVVVPWKDQLVMVIAKNFRCHCYVQLGRWTTGGKRRAIMVVGFPSDVAIVRNLVNFAVEVGESACRSWTLNQYYKVQRHSVAEGLRMRASWCSGYVHGIDAKFKEQVRTDSSVALMVITPVAVTQYVQNLRLTPGAVSHQRIDRFGAAYHNGYETGRSFNEPSKRLRG